MTKKKKIIIGVVVGCIILGSLPWIWASAVMVRYLGGMTAPRTSREAIVAVKDFEPLELVFVTTSAKKETDDDVYGLLLGEAKKLGAHAIINVNIDTKRQGWFGEVTMTGSALAIKYSGSVGVPATDNNFGGLSQIWRGFWRHH
ncbi:MAG: hypothetical protein Ta2G_20610 [Termitinemataceae bacterium]|nr:MAG: hypothetical protein Ta2G_20610 [Termitinemataceae bacterium]